MRDNDRILRRSMLKPITRRKVGPATPKLVASALDHLDKRALGSAMLPDLMRLQKEARKARSKGSWKESQAASVSVVFARAMLMARRISQQEYTFLVAVAAEGVHEARVMAGEYPEIVELTNSLRSIETAHGLTDDEFWTVDEQPREYC